MKPTRKKVLSKKMLLLLYEEQEKMIQHLRDNGIDVQKSLRDAIMKMGEEIDNGK